MLRQASSVAIVFFLTSCVVANPRPQESPRPGNDASKSSSTTSEDQKKFELYHSVAKELNGMTDLSDLDEIHQALVPTLKRLPTESFHRYQLQRIADCLDESIECTPELTIEAAHEALRTTAGQIKFSPQIEAASPEGFPGPTPVGEVEVKKYPAYRMAKTDLTGEPASTQGAPAFFRLFNHIQSNEIAMTAPVEMVYTRKSDKLKESSMAFLYRNQGIGSVGEKGNVTVTDSKPTTVIATGLRGDLNNEQIEDAVKKLRAWAVRIAPKGELGESVRVLGYNGPSVDPANRFYEVQLELIDSRD